MKTTPLQTHKAESFTQAWSDVAQHEAETPAPWWRVSGPYPDGTYKVQLAQIR